MNLVFELTQVWVCITTKMAHMACYHCFVLCFHCPVAHGLDGPVALCPIRFPSVEAAMLNFGLATACKL